MSPRAATCGTCGSLLYTNGTCPLCDRPRLVPAPPVAPVLLDVEVALLLGVADAELRGEDIGERWAA